MGKLFVISDTHGRYDELMEALRAARIIDVHGNRQLPRKDKLYSIGDLINGVRDSYIGDNKCLDLVGPVIDGIVVGNHEMPYIDPGNVFDGFHPYGHIADRIWSLMERDVILPCAIKGDTLVTHAGCHAKWGYESAEETAGKLKYEWKLQNYGHYLFSAIGYARGGRERFGGVLWCDFNRELQSAFPQVVGHTSGETLRIQPNALCIDVGARNGGRPAIIEVR